MNSYFKSPKILVVFIVFIFSSCSMVQPIQFVGVDNIMIAQGSSVKINADVKLYNSNAFKFKLIDSDLEIFIENISLGKLKLQDGLVINKKEEFVSPIELKIGFMELLSSGPNLLPKLFMREFDVQVKGEITVKAFLFKRTMPIDYRENVKL